MEAWLTNEWQRTSAWQILLRPVSWLFRLLVAIRRGAYKAGLFRSLAVRVPVIVVGNVTVGGTGKTPLVLALVKALGQGGLKCGIVTRGYLGKAGSEGRVPVQIMPGAAAGAMLSDEASLLATRSGAPVFACTNRFEAARQLLHQYPEVNVIISDDGLQHYALQRDLEICVIDGERVLGNGALLPSGPLREPQGRLKSVDLIVINGNGGDETLARLGVEVPRFHFSLANESFINLKTARCLQVNEALKEFQGASICALAGIGNPHRFFTHVCTLGFALAATKPFGDHFQYALADMPDDSAGIILMTEKDAVKCGSFADDRMWFMRVDAVLPTEFVEFVAKKLFK